MSEKVTIELHVSPKRVHELWRFIMKLHRRMRTEPPEATATDTAFLLGAATAIVDDVRRALPPEPDGDIPW